MMHFVTLFVTIFVVFSFVNSQDYPVVNTTYGDVYGITTTENNVASGHTDYKLTRFLAIPYAKPPVGILRFMKPAKMDPWTNAYNATEFGASCYSVGNPDNSSGDPLLRDFLQQKPYIQSEDCLNLNIYYAGNFSATRLTSSLNVMVFIHGGAYTAGNQNGYDGSLLSYFQDVLVVTMNYRVGLFGFASTADGVIPGNMGLFDQHAALFWIHENIGYFGGDKSKVTIFGESAGGDSVLIHLASPVSNGLFNRAIIQSVPGLIQVSREANSAMVLNLVQSLGCDISDSNILLQCLQQLTVTEINNLPWPNGNGVCIDGEFLLDQPISLFEKGQYNTSIDIIMGYNDGDGDVILSFAQDFTYFPMNWSVEFAMQLVQNFMMFFMLTPNEPVGNWEIVMDIIRREYFLEVNTSDNITRKVIDVLTDMLFVTSTLTVANTLAANGGPGKVYVYKFDYRSSISYDYFNLNQTWMNTQLTAAHGDELFFIFGTAYANDGQDRKMVLSMMQSWAEFARTGEPTYITDSSGVIMPWQPYTETNKSVFLVQAPLSNMSSAILPDNVQSSYVLWHSTLPTIMGLQSVCPTSNVECPTYNVACPTSNEDNNVNDENSDKGILNLSNKMSDILLIVSASGLLFFIIITIILLSLFVNQSRKYKG